MSWRNILKMPTDDPEEWREQMGDVTNTFMLTNKTWNEAGGQVRRNYYSRDEELNPDKPTEGFRFASLDEIEEILGRELTVDDFSVSSNNWMHPEGDAFNKIGLEGQRILAERYLIYVKKHKTFPVRVKDVDGTSYTYNNMDELLEGSDRMHIALELVGHMKGLDILGL